MSRLIIGDESWLSEWRMEDDCALGSRLVCGGDTLPIADPLWFPRMHYHQCRCLREIRGLGASLVDMFDNVIKATLTRGSFNSRLSSRTPCHKSHTWRSATVPAAHTVLYISPLLLKTNARAQSTFAAIALARSARASATNFAPSTF